MFWFTVIWFEHFGSDVKRTIVNRLVSSVCWSTIGYFMFPQMVDIARYIVGPLPAGLCTFNLFIKNVLTLQILFFFDASIVMKYVSIFWLKNPIRLQDEFWDIFIYVWVILFSFLGQFVGDFLPNTKPINYYICTGVPPLNHRHDVVSAKNIFVIRVSQITVLAYFVYCIRIYSYKLTHKAKSTKKSLLLANFEKKSLSDLTSNFGYIIIIILGSSLMRKMNSIDIRKVNEYPVYLSVYFLHLGMVNSCAIVQCFVYYLMHPNLRATLFREIKELVGKVSFNIDY